MDLEEKGKLLPQRPGQQYGGMHSRGQGESVPVKNSASARCELMETTWAVQRGRCRMGNGLQSGLFWSARLGDLIRTQLTPPVCVCVAVAVGGNGSHVGGCRP